MKKAELAWFCQYTTTQSNADKTWKALTNDFLAEFGSGESKGGVRAKFEKRKQGVNEDIKSYFFELLVLQQKLDSTMSDESFRSHFEKGLLPSLAETFYMFATPSMSKNEIKNFVLKISEVKKLTLINNISADSASLTTQQYPCKKWANHGETTKNQTRSGLPSTRTKNGRPKCFNCGKPGHFAAGCRSKGQETTQEKVKKCFVFEKPGHFVAVCRSNPQNNHTNAGKSQWNRGPKK